MLIRGKPIKQSQLIESGSSYRLTLIAFFFVFMITIGSFANVSDAQVSMYNMNIPFEIEQDKMVRGFWHNITVSTTSDDLSITFTRGTVSKNETNHYVWSYKNSIWQDELYGNTYIDTDNCIKSTTNMVFRIGVDSSATNGNWDIEIKENSAIVHSGIIGIVSSNRDFALAAPDLFIIGELNSTAWESPVIDQYFRLLNVGNVPLGEIEFTFSDELGNPFDDNFRVTNESQRLFINGDSKHYLTFLFSDNLQAQDIVQIDCLIKAKALHVIPTTNSHILESILANQFSITVYIKQPGDYSVDAASGLIYEYQEFMEAIPDKELLNILYITALKDITFSVGVNAVGINVTEVAYDNEIISTLPLQSSLSIGETSCLKVKTIAGKENYTANLSYLITPTGDGTEILQTQINIGFKELPVERTWLLGLAAGSLALVIVLGIVSTLKKKKNVASHSEEISNNKNKKRIR